MTKRIFRSIFVVAAAVLLASFALITGVLYEHFSNNQMQQLRAQTSLAAQGVEKSGDDYFAGLDARSFRITFRITWIASDGTVLYDSDSQVDPASMENHASREEVSQALKNGSGESTRYSKTLMERQLYSAQKLSDGTVIRLSCQQYTPLTLVLGMLQPVIVIAAVALGASLWLASGLSKRIVRPLNELTLDQPERIQTYEELTPLTEKLRSQQNQLHHQEQELRRRRDEFDAATAGMIEGLVLLNEQGVILSINNAATSLLNISRYCVGKDILLLNNSLQMRELLGKVRAGEHCEMQTEHGGVDYRIYASPVISGDKVTGAVLLIIDMTEKEKGERLRREFSANVSHELKTPLQTISGCAEILANGIVKPADVPHFALQIQSEAKRMIKLVDDIIKLSHLDEGAEDMQREQLDLRRVADATVENLRPAAKQADVRLTVEGESAVIEGIPQLLEAIVFNLCENAIKYNRPGGYVKVTTRRTETAAILTVEDNGIGIPEEQQERIFERFYRVDKSHSKEVGGTGLGLSIVKHAAAVHNASISTQSSPGKGTRISVSFPV